MAPKKLKKPNSTAHPKKTTVSGILAQRVRKSKIQAIKKELEKIQQAGDAARKKATMMPNNKEAEETAQRETEQKKQAFIEAQLISPASSGRRIDLPPVIPDECITEEQIKAYEMRLITFHIGLIRKMDATSRTFNQYFSPIWTQWFSTSRKAKNLVYQNVQKHRTTARVYYLPHFIAKTEIPRLLSAVPAMCTGSDGIIHLQSPIPGHQVIPSKSPKKEWLREGNQYSSWTLDSGGSKSFDNLLQAIAACPRLLNIFERRRSRMKCIASNVDIFATHGYLGKGPLRKRPANIRQNIVAITGVAPQFDTSYLDYADFIFEEDMYPSRLECYQTLGRLPSTWATLRESSIDDNQERFYRLPGRRIFHAAGYLQTMKDSFFLWLRAFDDQVRQRSSDSKGYLQITAMGCDSAPLFTAGKTEVKDLADLLAPLLLQAIEETLEDNYFPNIIKIGFCDYSGRALFCPTKDYIQHINLIPCPYINLCQFENVEYKKYVCGLLVPGNSFSLPGNEHGYDSIEAEIGINTSLRNVQSYIHNEHLVDPRNHVAVDGPCMLFAGQEAQVKAPCIISDTNSVQDYTWTGAAQPIITGNIAREGSMTQ